MPHDHANVGQLLLAAAHRWPHGEALVEVVDSAVDPTAGPSAAATRRLTWAELADAALAVAAALQRQGFGLGHRIGLLGQNDAAYVVHWFGVTLAGALLAPLPALSAPEEIAWRADHAKLDLILHDRATAVLARDAAARFAAHGATAQVWSQDRLTADNTRIGDIRTGDARTAAICPALTHSHDPALLLYTSGTTGRSKGALISHGTLLAHTAQVTTSALRLTAADTVLAALPFSHSFGCRMVLLACAQTGAKMLIFRRFRAVRVWQTLHDHAVTWLPVVPTMLAALVRADVRLPLPHLKWCLSAGATLAEPARLAAATALGAPVYQGYGLTEATFTSMDHPPALPTPGGVGPPVLGVSVRLVDTAGEDVPTGERGEVWIRGDNTFLGYLDDPEATAQVRTDGWVHSGDLGVRDVDGGLRIVGRLKDLIVRGGYNVYPSEVEAALLSHPDVHQVAVIGVPDAYLGQEVVALLVPQPDHPAPSPAILDIWARDRLARYKVPRRYGQLSEMPLGPSHKVLKRVLRRRVLAGELRTTSP